MTPPRWHVVPAVLLLLLWRCDGVEGGGACYPSGAVAGIVVATIVVTLVAAGLGAAVAWRFWWTPRQKEQEGRARRPETQHQQKNPSDFAFDNPYFRNNQEADEQDAAGRRKPSINKSSLRSSKLSEASAKAKKARGGKNPFGFGGGKKKAQDDSCIASVEEPERAFVSLRGHDFTGLGFNICGNMRDGILVKDVLHRGPASESGLIKAGDRIVNVTVSFTNIVYEDALTILSYASPYDVQLEIERVPLASSSSGAPKRLGSCSFNNSGQKLFHPLYRSQSIDDLTQIDGGGGAGGGTFPSHGGGPRRSQSVGVAAHKLAAHFGKKDEGKLGAASLVLSATGSLNEKMLANVMTDSRGGLQWEKRFEDTLDNDDDCPKDVSSSGKDPSSAYLDCPHNKLKLELRSESPGSDLREGGASIKTVVEVSGRDLDHRRQGAKTTVDASSSSSRGRRGRKGDEENNDSDVSRDSLEVSQHRGYVKRSAKAANLQGSSLDERQLFPQKIADDSLSSDRTTRIERTHPKERSAQSSRTHGSSLSSNEEADSSVDTSSTPTAKPTHHHRPNVFTTPYAERQSTSEGSYCGGKISDDTSEFLGGRSSVYSGSKLNNGGVADDHRGNRQQGPEDRPQSKFCKKAPAGGMFTQINPFQVSSLKQQRARGPWQANGSSGEPSEFLGGRSNVYSGPKLSLKDSAIKHRQF